MADNTFQTATNLGTLGGSNPKPVQFRGSLTAADPIDTYKFKANLSSSFRARSSYQIEGGSFRLSLYAKNPLNNSNQLLLKRSIAPGKGSADLSIPGLSSLPITGFPGLSATGTFYIKLDRPMQNVNYQFRLTPLS